MTDKKPLQDEETKKVDGGVFPGLSGFPSPAKVTPKLTNEGKNEPAPTKKPGVKEQE